MKKILAALAVISVVTPFHSELISADAVYPSSVREYELPDGGRDAWYRIRDEWMRNRYPLCLKKFRLRMSCGDCVYIYMKGNITIDSSGRMSRFNETASNVCSKKIPPALRECFLKPLKEKVFPDNLKGKEFETMLGTGLKC